MSEPAGTNLLVRILAERPDDWRTLADLAMDFAPPHMARAAQTVLADHSAGPAVVLEAIEAADGIVIEDAPLVAGSIEPESLDFSMISTISPEADASPTMDLDFGAGLDEEHLFGIDTAIEIDALDDLGSDGWGADVDHLGLTAEELPDYDDHLPEPDDHDDDGGDDDDEWDLLDGGD